MSSQPAITAKCALRKQEFDEDGMRTPPPDAKSAENSESQLIHTISADFAVFYISDPARAYSSLFFKRRTAKADMKEIIAVIPTPIAP